MHSQNYKLTPLSRIMLRIFLCLRSNNVPPEIMIIPIFLLLQVVCVKTISNEKRLQAVAQKVVLQINCKLGGELWGCRTPFKRLMVVGIDVFHDKSLKSGSIAGIVSSINDSLSRYYSTVAIQKQGQEIIDSLKVAFMQALIRY
jgi:aubergine-like protein